jgi:hypothetical protein
MFCVSLGFFRWEVLEGAAGWRNLLRLLICSDRLSFMSSCCLLLSIIVMCEYWIGLLAVREEKKEIIHGEFSRRTSVVLSAQN